MKTKMMKLLSVLLVLVCVVGYAPTAAAATAENESTLSVTQYTVTDENNLTLNRITKGQKVNLIIELRDTAMRTNQITSAADIDVSRVIDGFSGGTPTVEVLSKDNELLTLRITVKGGEYTGQGNIFKSLYGYKNIQKPYQSFMIEVRECKEYVEPTPPSDTGNNGGSGSPITKPAPQVQIGRSDITEPIRPNQEFTLKIWVRNLGSNTMESPLVTFTASDGLMLMENTSTFALQDLSAGATNTVTLRFKAVGEITSPHQSVTADVKFNYFNGDTTVAGTASDKLTIPAQPKKQTTPGTPLAASTPSIIISSYDYGGQQIAVGSRLRRAASSTSI